MEASRGEAGLDEDQGRPRDRTALAVDDSPGDHGGPTRLGDRLALEPGPQP